MGGIVEAYTAMLEFTLAVIPILVMLAWIAFILTL